MIRMYFRASDPSKEALVSPHHVAAPETQRMPHVLFAALHERSHRARRLLSNLRVVVVVVAAAAAALLSLPMSPASNPND